MTKHELAAATKAAAKEEEERRKRIAARQKMVCITILLRSILQGIHWNVKTVNMPWIKLNLNKL